MTVMMNLLRLKAETALLFPMPLDLQRMLQRIFQEKVMKVAMKMVPLLLMLLDSVQRLQTLFRKKVMKMARSLHRLKVETA